MSPSRPFIERPVATSLLMLAIVLAGMVGFRFLPLSALPQVDYPTIQVQTLYPGASPEVMSHTVTAPLEVIEADGPTVATVFAPLVTSASAYAPESPTSETEPIVTCALARYSDVACTLADADAVIVPFMSAVV